MDAPQPKKRKTSPPEETDRASSPLKKPPRRPSFASPTKASLARYNPNLLPRPASSGSAVSRPNSRGEVLTRGQQAHAFVLGESEALHTASDVTQSDDQDQAVAGADQQSPRDRAPSSRMTGRGTRVSAPPGDSEEEDAGLPISPSARALEQQDTPRRGVLFSSPSKRPPRLKVMAKKPAAISKPRLQSIRSSRARSKEVDDEAAEKEEPKGETKKKEPQNPELEKKKQEKAKLLSELDELESEVSEFTKLVHEEQERSEALVIPQNRLDKLIKLINKIDPSKAEEEEQAPSVSSLLCSFLPFSRPVAPPRKSSTSPEKPVPSHRPLELEDPLPYLEMFTSFRFTSRLSLPDLESFSPTALQYLQTHTIDIVGPQKLLRCTIVMTVDTTNNRVVNLQITHLSPWAERDLGKYMRAKAQKNNISAVCWALGSYWEYAQRRAKCWHRCEEAFEHLLPGRTNEDTENARAANIKRKRRGLPRKALAENRSHEEEDEEVFGVYDGDGSAPKKKSENLFRPDLHRYLGRELLVLENASVLVHITWRIGFDWTGEAESVIEIQHAVPKVYSETNESESLKKIPATFNALVNKMGVYEATKAMVGLLFKE
ncbi:hypothetical protein K469DRAFT_622585 [Zopfia rhizophila CBS 207.26]|uniref:Uncharacterized protein n=1 Tax=Zopfia rhizophila CBS 207.26 TaxID=1314779 RepID=A0A6A6EKA3_9PEZI|nr:hypothetical protein K469DRAFT_622585 [Zopfia rhizophila CBS 207.26]